MDIMQMILIFIVGGVASFVQRVSGFGMGVVSMMFLPYLVTSPITAGTISNMTSSITSTTNAIRYRKDIAFKTILPVLISAMLIIPPSVSFAKRIPTASFTVILGIVMILLSIYFLFVGKRLSIKPTLLKGIGCGLCSGVMNGLFSTAGPPLALYLSAALSNKQVYFATIQFFFGASNIYTVAVRIMNGLVTGQVLMFAAAFVIGAFCGDAIGRGVFKKLDGAKVKKLIYLSMMLSGIVMVVRNL
jgi:uncharacterized membrane protein YfcA